MKALIDSDTVAFAPAATAEDADEWVAISRTKEMVERILVATKATEFELWLSGANNFRYTVYPEYKAGRINAYRPKHEQACKQYLIEEWHANLTDGCEADDMVGVRQMEEFEKTGCFDTTIICHMDKDIDMIPGWHYNWPLTRLGKTIREESKYFTDFADAFRVFCYQLLVGDPTDNIKGVVGIGPKKANALLDGTPQEEWLARIKDLYSCDEEFDLNAKCLWIWRKKNDVWNGLRDVSVAS